MNKIKRKSKGSYHKACRVHQIYNEKGSPQSNFRNHREVYYSNFRDGFRMKKGKFLSLFLFGLETITEDPLYSGHKEVGSEPTMQAFNKIPFSSYLE